MMFKAAVILFAVCVQLLFLTLAYDSGLEDGLEASMGTGDKVWDCAYSRIVDFALCSLEKK